MMCACSPQRNTRSTRAYHELTTRYNVFFNAQQEYDEIFDRLFEDYQDNSNELLKMYPNSHNPNDTIEKKKGGPFDIVVEKTTKAIQEHSISAKPIRDRDKMNSQAYRDWLRQNEFNPFIDQAWLLLGKAHIQNGDYMDAISVFSNSIRLFSHDIDVISEAQVWLVRAYAEIGWFSDAEVVIDALEARTVPPHLRSDFVNSYSFLLLQLKQYENLVPVLSEAVALEKNRTQRRRLLYLLGQVNVIIGDNGAAYNAFEKIKGLTTPNEISLSALLAQSKVEGEEQRVIARLKKQAKQSKNEQLMDQIYGAIGDYYLNINDTISAVENYLKGESASVRNGAEKAYLQLKLGDIYYNQKLYVESGEKYLSASEKLPTTHVDYKVVLNRAQILSELSPHLKAVHHQDSLQHLAELPRIEQVKIINQHIKELKSAAQLNEPTQQFATPVQDEMTMIGATTPDQFYFYNQQLVIQGRSEFVKRWGNRKLEDNWRILSKSGTNQIHDSEGANRTETDDEIDSNDEQTDIYSVDYYLNQLPTTDQEIEQSNNIIVEALMNIGDISRSKLSDYTLAYYSYHRVSSQYKYHSYAIDAIYKLYMLSLQMENLDQAYMYKAVITDDYPDSSYAQMIMHPDYENTIANYSNAEYELYKSTLEAYQNENMEEVRQHFHTAELLFQQGRLMPKQKLLFALSYAYHSEVDSLKQQLSDIVDKYSDEPEADLAKNILEGLNDGCELVANASILRSFGMPESEVKVGEIMQDDSTTIFSDNNNQPHYALFLFDDKKISKSSLTFAISNHNFTNYQLRSFSISFNRVDGTEAMIVKPFHSLDETNYYIDNVRQDSVFSTHFADSIRSIAISEANFNTLLVAASIDDYKEFSNHEEQVMYGSKIIELTDEPQVDEVVIDKTQPYTVQKTDSAYKAGDKLRELEIRQEQAISQYQNQESEKDRREQIREREKERAKIIKQRQQEIKQREKDRKKELKLREKERKKKIKEQDKIRKEKLKERARLLRKQNR